MGIFRRLEIAPTAGLTGRAIGVGFCCSWGWLTRRPREAAATDLDECDVERMFAASAIDGRRGLVDLIDRAVVLGDRGETAASVGTGGLLAGSSD